LNGIGDTSHPNQTPSSSILAPTTLRDLGRSTKCGNNFLNCGNIPGPWWGNAKLYGQTYYPGHIMASPRRKPNPRGHAEAAKPVRPSTERAKRRPDHQASIVQHGTASPLPCRWSAPHRRRLRAADARFLSGTRTRQNCASRPGPPYYSGWGSQSVVALTRGGVRGLDFCQPPEFLAVWGSIPVSSR
jgi:hypothetical protein